MEGVTLKSPSQKIKGKKEKPHRAAELGFKRDGVGVGRRRDQITRAQSGLTGPRHADLSCT